MNPTQNAQLTRQLRIRRGADRQDAIFSSRIDGSGATKIYVCVHPIEGGDSARQIREIYGRLGDFLRAQGASPRNVISEKIFFSDLPAQVDDLREVRAAFYGGDGDEAPATTYLNQPPCRPGALCELQARVLFAEEEGAMTVTPIQGLRAPAVGKIVSYHGYDHIYVHNLTGGEPGDGLSYAAQMEDVFDQADRLLRDLDISFHQVIRTWIYLHHMERDYDALNDIRNRYFESIGLDVMPASTGIQGGVYPVDRDGSLDLYALRTNREVPVEQMHADSLNEAWSYGSAFARGMTAVREDRKVIYLSGTASIDTAGNVVHVGDIEMQVHRMLLNVEKLLVGSGATPADAIRATTYLKHAEDFEVFQRVYRERGFPTEIPHTICNADVCRPDWLVEIEVAAIVSPDR